MGQTGMPLLGGFAARFYYGFVTGVCSFGLLSGLALSATAQELPAHKRSGADFFKTTNTWTVHFHFTPDQWDAMPPEEPEGGMFGRGGPGGPGRGRGAPGGFGPGMFLSPAFMQADENNDKKVSREEFSALADKWFTRWDKKNAGALGEDELREGLTGAIMGGGVGGGGGRGPGINLQGAEGKRNGLASAAGIEFKYVKADLKIGNQSLSNVAVRYKGNGTWMGSRFDKKRSMKVELNEFVKGQKFAGASKLNFHNCVTDASYMNEVLSYELYRDAGVPASRTAYARVYVDVPGKYRDEYFGLYSIVENVDNAFVEERFGTKKGAMFKPVTHEPFADLGNDWVKYKQTYDPKTSLSDEQKKRVIEFCKLVSNATDSEFESKLGEYLDLDNFSRYLAVTVWLSTLDSILSIGQNYYVYLHPKTGKMNFIPWDLDHSFGQFFMVGSQDQREKLSIEKPWQGQNRFFERVFKTAAFQKLYRARLEEFNKTIFQPERFVKQVDQLAAVLRPAVKDESESKLARFDKVVAGESVEPAGFGPPPGQGGPGGPGPGPREGRGFGGFMQPAKPIKGFVKARAQSVSAQLNGKEKGESLDEGFGRGGPGRPGGPGGPGGFGPGNFIAPAFLAQFDADHNGKLSREELKKGFDGWFQRWDKNKADSLTEEQIRNGLNETFRPPDGGPGGPGFRPFGGPPGAGPQP